MIELPIGQMFERIIEWLQINLEPFFDIISNVLTFAITNLESALQFLPSPALIIILALVAWKVAGRGVGIFTLLGLFLIESMGLWDATMETLALVIISALIALIIGVPLGIWSSRSNVIDRMLRPVLDFMQTMPAFVYLIPAVLFFNMGKVPGAVATVIFATPPVVRLTNLGIRQVPEDVVEAGQSFGSTSRQMLFKVQLPIALPTILAGINQTILLSLSMVVIAAMIGARGLGEKVLQGITQLKIGVGFESGIAVVILAMVLDRITQAIGNSTRNQ